MEDIVNGLQSSGSKTAMLRRGRTSTTTHTTAERKSQNQDQKPNLPLKGKLLPALPGGETLQGERMSPA